MCSDFGQISTIVFGSDLENQISFYIMLTPCSPMGNQKKINAEQKGVLKTSFSFLQTLRP